MLVRFGQQAFALFLLALFPSTSASANEALPYILGVGVHHGTFIQKPIYEVGETKAALQKYQFSSFRDDLGWSHLTTSGVEIFPPRLGRLRELLDGTHKTIKPILALTGGDPAYNKGVLPTTPEARDRYAFFAGEAARVSKVYNPILEIWNEWNLGTGTRAHVPGTADDYTALALKAYPAIKAVAPHLTVLVGGMGTDLDPDKTRNEEWVWTRRAISQGMLKAGDGLSVHFYNVCRPVVERRPSEQIERLRLLDQLLTKENDGKPYPIYITEVGWPEKMRGCGFTSEEQIAFSSQFLIWVTAFPSVKGVWLYELKDSGIDPNNLEHHFGLLNNVYEEKPYMCGVTATRDILKGATFKRESKTADGAVEIELVKSGGSVRAIWLPYMTSTVNYTIPAGYQASFICDNTVYGAGKPVKLSERPLILTSEKR